ncbi:universal stress protein PHOS32 [Capsicum annuum]
MQKQSPAPPHTGDSDIPNLGNIKIKCSSPRFPPPITTAGAAAETPTAGAQRKIGIAVDLSDESAFAVKWSVHNYLRSGDVVVLLHVRPTSVLYGADWGSVDLSIVDTVNVESQRKLEDDFDAFTTAKSSDLAKPLDEARIPYKIHIVKDHDMKERLCLEVERLGLSAVIMGSRGFGAKKRGSDGRLGSVSDYCVRHCVCPVVVVRYDDEKDGGNVGRKRGAFAHGNEEEGEYHDARDGRQVIIESRGFRAKKRGRDGRLGSVGDYCVRHCVCPVVVVRHVDEKDGGNVAPKHVVFARENEEEGEYRDAFDGRQGLQPAKEKGARTDN